MPRQFPYPIAKMISHTLWKEIIYFDIIKGGSAYLACYHTVGVTCDLFFLLFLYIHPFLNFKITKADINQCGISYLVLMIILPIFSKISIL